MPVFKAYYLLYYNSKESTSNSTFGLSMNIQDTFEHVNQTLVKALNNKDFWGCLAIYDTNAQVLPPNQPIITGQSALKHFFESWIEQIHGSISLHLKSFEFQGTLAYQVYSYQIISGQKSDKGKLVHVMRKSNDDEWKIVLTIFNSDLPALIK